MQLQDRTRSIINFRRLESQQTKGRAPSLELLQHKTKQKAEVVKAKKITEYRKSVSKPQVSLQSLWRQNSLLRVVLFLIFLNNVVLDHIRELF